MLFFGTLHSNGYVYLSFSSLPFSSLLFTTVHKASSANCFIFESLFLGVVLILASCIVSRTSVRSSSVTFLFKMFVFYLLTFGCAGSSLLHRLFSTCGEQGLSLAALCWLFIAVVFLVVELGL